ncbi:hypothetical protein DENSPDRAFT_837320 [Dentipellis sp. KUC8613]|nr:hypothetical protein DENSPDRAFT_837320 [Dentipellis sp. KUC8613]
MNNFGLFERYARAYHSGETDDEDDESGARNSDSNDTAAPPRSLQDILSDSAVAGLPALPFPDDINELINGGPPIENAAAKRQFVPPAGTTSPADLFKPMMNACTVPGPRWIYHDPATGVNSVLIFTGGLALNDGQENARAGYSVIFRPDARVEIGQALEFVPGYALTQDRAHLRAAVAALRLRYWAGEGFWRIVIGATSEYVVQNAGERLERWRANRWKYSNGRAVKNKDLWMLLLEELELFERKGVSVQFYLLDAQSAARVMKVAKRGATSNKIPIELTDVLVAAC